MDEVADESVEVIAHASDRVGYTVLGLDRLDGILQFREGIAEPRPVDAPWTDRSTAFSARKAVG